MHRQINKPTCTQTRLQPPAVDCCVNSAAARVNHGVKGGWVVVGAGTEAANQREAAAVVLKFNKSLRKKGAQRVMLQTLTRR